VIGPESFGFGFFGSGNRECLVFSWSTAAIVSESMLTFSEPSFSTGVPFENNNLGAGIALSNFAILCRNFLISFFSSLGFSGYRADCGGLRIVTLHFAALTTRPRPLSSVTKTAVSLVCDEKS